MRGMLRYIRGAIGIGVTWAVAWFVVGLVPRWVLGINADAPFPLIFGTFGFLAGVVFSTLLAMAEGRRRFDQMSLPRFAGWGAVGGLLLSAGFARIASLGWADVAAVAPAFAVACAACASGSLAIARRAARLAAPARDPGGLRDPYAGRTPTSHERAAGRPWDASYRAGPPPWDIGRPQPAIVRLAADGGLAGPVLDVGCGTGEHALHLAALGLEVVGVDVAETALAIAREKAAERGLAAAFTVADALRLDVLDRTFRTVLDCGLFHSFDPEERRAYAASLAKVTEPGGTLHVLCFSDQGPECGPHPVSRADLGAAFRAGTGWTVARIEPCRVETRMHDHGAPAWLATMTRTPVENGC